MKYIKPSLTVSGLQGFCSEDGYALTAQDAPIYRAGEKVAETVEFLDWTIPAGALVSIAGDVMLDGDSTPPICLGSGVSIDYDNNQLAFVLDCDYEMFYEAVANKIRGRSLYVQFRFTWTDDAGDQEAKIIALAMAMPAVTGTGEGAPAQPGAATTADVLEAFAQGKAYSDSKIALHNTAEDAHADIRQALAGKLSSSDIMSGDKIDPTLLPGIALTSVTLVTSQEEMLALENVQPGDVAKRSDLGCSFILASADSTLLANWIRVTDATQGGGSGSVWLNGSSDPQSGSGEDGYYHINNTTKDYSGRLQLLQGHL
jgi:hypothetical protein